MITVRERRRYSTSAAYTTAKVHINVLPPPPPPKEIRWVQPYMPPVVIQCPPVVQPTPAPLYNIEATSEEIADRIYAENTERNKRISLEARLEDEKTRRLELEQEVEIEKARRDVEEAKRGVEEAKRKVEEAHRETEKIYLREREERARRRVADEYTYQSKSLGSSPRTSGESLWSAVAVTSTSSHGGLVVHDHRHGHGHHHHHHHGHRSHSESRDHRCTRCGDTDHRSRDCRVDTIYIPQNRVRHITYRS